MDSEHFVTGQQGEFYVTPEVQADYDNHGYVLVRGLINEDEMKKLKYALENSEDIRNNVQERSDGDGAISKLCLWNYAGNDVTGVMARCQKVAGTMQALMGGDEIYHYHTKLMMKEARTGGKFVWHQDYGYWYNNGCLYPDMATVFIPVDKCTKSNGCLQVLKGSHKMGRVNHLTIGDQAGMDPERLEHAQTALPLVHVEMEPGDALFFHCNLMHCSSRNDSQDRRWAFLVAYNKRKNNPVKVHHCPLYHPLRMLPNSALSECNVYNSTEEKWFMRPGEVMDPLSTEPDVKEQYALQI